MGRTESGIPPSSSTDNSSRPPSTSDSSSPPPPPERPEKRRTRIVKSRLLRRAGIYLGHLDWTGVFTALGALGTFAAATVAAYQLQDANHNLRIDRANNTLQLVLFSDQMIKITDEIAAKTDNGRNYIPAATDLALRRRIAQYMNGLEIMSYGANMCLFDEHVLHSMLAINVYKQVQAQLLGRPGNATTGNEWKVENPLFGPESYAELRKLYARWFPDGRYTVDPPRPPDCKEST
jgi:hypothetical protein